MRLSAASETTGRTCLRTGRIPPTPFADPSGRRIRLVDQAMLDRVVDELGLIGHAHLLHQARLVGADRLDRKVQLLADLGDGPAGHEQAKYLVLAVGKRGMWWSLGLRHRAERELLGDLGADERASGRDLADRRGKLT